MRTRYFVFLGILVAGIIFCFVNFQKPTRSSYERLIQDAERWLDQGYSENQVKSAILTWDDFQQWTAQSSPDSRRLRADGIVLTAKGRLLTMGMPGAPD